MASTKSPANPQSLALSKLPKVTESFSKTIRINDWLPPKAYFDCEQAEVDWLLLPFSPTERELFQTLARQPEQQLHGKAAYHTFDCSIMNIADDIAYGVHDLEDAIHLRLINRLQLDEPMFRQLLAATPAIPKPAGLGSYEGSWIEWLGELG